MIFDSLGIGELGVVVALVVVLVKPKELGKVMREFGKFKRKVRRTPVLPIAAAFDEGTEKFK